MAHQIFDKASVFVDLFGATAIRDPRCLNHGCIVTHIIDNSNETVVEYRSRLIQNFLQRGRRRPPRRPDIAALIYDLVSVFWSELHVTVAPTLVEKRGGMVAQLRAFIDRNITCATLVQA